MEISGSPGGGGVHVSKGGCTCKQKGCTGRCSHIQRDLHENFEKGICVDLVK